MTVESHPLQPFLPPNARLLMLGSFPPPRGRWCMDFFYPNRTNQMWEIFGLVFFGDSQHFVDGKTFRKEEIINLLKEQGIAKFCDRAKRLAAKAGMTNSAISRSAVPIPPSSDCSSKPHLRASISAFGYQLGSEEACSIWRSSFWKGRTAS